MAQKVAAACAAEKLPFIFKASYDKANRTSVRSFRGIGAREGCALLGEIGREIEMPVTTDVHSPNDAEIAADFIDVLQIPAFLCRQTDLIRAAAETGRVVNVKKGQFLAPWDVRNIAEKLHAFGARKFFFTERGTTFGYNNLVADMRSLAWLREAGYHVIFDATHSVQRPGGRATRPRGRGARSGAGARARRRVRQYFMEVHETPGAPSLTGRIKFR
jgi:2-dehydro-3-deoxyphosphooctonate aldolase (KDO 8-P synthase)